MGYFLPLHPFALKNENFTKMKKCLEISSFYTSVPKIMIICYTVPEIWYVMYVIVIFHFGLFFALLLPYQPKNSKFQKNKKNTWRYHHFTHVYQKLWLDDVRFLRYGARQMDGWTNRQKKWHKRWVPHLKMIPNVVSTIFHFWSPTNFLVVCNCILVFHGIYSLYPQIFFLWRAKKFFCVSCS